MDGIGSKLPDIKKYIPETLDPLAPIVCMAVVMEDVQEYISNMPEKQRARLYALLKKHDKESQ